MSRPNIIWISVDSLRADHLPLGGYEKNTAPHISNIASSADGQWVSDCIAQGRWTPASTASILTSTHLSTHGVGASSNAGQLPDHIQTIPELLQKAGYQTAGLSSNAFLSSASKLNRGFGKFEYLRPSDIFKFERLDALAKYMLNVRKYGGGFSLDKSLHNRSYIMHQVAKDWLSEFDQQNADFFTYIHYNSTHYPYTPPKPFLRPFLDDVDMRIQEAVNFSKRVYDDLYVHIADGCDFSETEWNAIEALYDAEIAYIDELIGELFDFVQKNVDDNTIFVITGDHGELFGEEGLIGHSTSIHDAIINVPLITYNFPCEIQSDVVEHIDVIKTLANFAVIESPQFEGINLRNNTRGVAISQRGPREEDKNEIRKHNQDYDFSHINDGHVNVARSKEYKLVVDDNNSNLYKLPDELEDVSDGNTQIKNKLVRSIPDSAIESSNWGDVKKADEFDDELEDRLSAMGYL